MNGDAYFVPALERLTRVPRIAVVLILAMLALGKWEHRCYAQHGDYVLGSGGLLTGAQPPRGIYYDNQPSYYWASNSTPFQRITTSGNLDVFVDLNTVGWTTSWEIFGANYGMSVTVPLVNTNGGLDVQTVTGQTFGRGGNQFGFSSVYVEPINLGWHFSSYDVKASFGFFAPAGDYDPHKLVNTGLGRWAEMFSLGGVAYLDRRKNWYLTGTARYLTHQSQEGVDLRVGDSFITEGGIGRRFATSIGDVNVGAVGYTYWQVTDSTGSAIPAALQGRRASTYALGPEINAATKYGLYYMRFFTEFGGGNTPQGNTAIAGVFLLF